MQLPKEFIERIKLQFPEDWKEVITSLEQEPITSIRYNSRKKTSEIYMERVPWTSDGYYLEQRPKFTLDPVFHAGAYYVQESSSMFVDFILRHLKTKISFDKTLDLCAAPGGKSTIILDHLEDDQYLVSNEIIPQRSSILRENLTKWGRPNFLVTQSMPKEFADLEDHFDLILIDAPCSGEGLFRKDKRAIDEWTLNNTMMCSERQNDIFHYVWDSLKEGGYLIYSTCTYNPDENENLINRLSGDGYEFECMELNIEEKWNIRVVKKNMAIGYQFLPHKVSGEGFFCAVLRKKGKYEKSVRRKSASQIHPIVLDYIYENQSLKEYSTYKFEKNLYLAPNSLLDQLNFYKKHLYIKQVGIDVAEENHGFFHPTHGLAMLSFQHREEMLLSVDTTQALQFLSKETFDTSVEDNGYRILGYENLPLGWIKQIGVRHNNYYPKNWRILMDWRKY